jgi:hemolysin activation/secretion protein
MSHQTIARRFSLAAFLALAGVPALAQTVPPQDAGRIMREAETLRPPVETPRQEALPVPEATDESAAVEYPEDTLFINAFQIENPEPFAAAEIEALLAPYTGRKLSMAEIEAARRAVSTFYQARGYYLAQAILPPQDARGGTLTLKVAIGRYDTVTLQNDSPVRDALIARIYTDIVAGRPAERDALERAFLLTSDLPGGQLPEVSARPGKAPGTTEMNIRIPAGKRYGGFVVYDNQGSRYTGRDRLGAGVDWNSPFGLGDRLSVSGVYGRGSSRHAGSARLSYQAPLSPTLRLEFALDRTTYTLGDQYEALDATGTARSAEAGARYVAIRSQNRTLEFHANVATRRLRDDFGAVAYSTEKKINSGTLGARFEQWGHLFGKNARGVAELQFTSGKLHFLDAAQRAANRQGANTQGHYQFLKFSGALDFALTKDWNLNLELTAQHALGKGLDGGEQLSITGAHATRAYRESLSADNAYILHVEARHILPAAFGIAHSVGVFADYGRGWFERPAYVTQNGVTAADAGLAYSASRGPLFLRAQLAHKIGAKPDERLAKRDGDTHFLLQAGLVF